MKIISIRKYLSFWGITSLLIQDHCSVQNFQTLKPVNTPPLLLIKIYLLVELKTFLVGNIYKRTMFTIFLGTANLLIHFEGYLALKKKK